MTTCLGSYCVEQDIQWFDTEVECKEMLPKYVNIPADGDWDTIQWVCKPVGSRGT